MAGFEFLSFSRGAIASLASVICMLVQSGVLADERESSEAETEPKSRPAILNASSIVNVGLMKAREETSTVVTVANPFDGPFIVKKVASSCRCTVATLAKQSVEKGQDLEIEVDIRPGETGAFSQTILLDGLVRDTRAGLAVTLRGRVQAELELEVPAKAWTIRPDLPANESAIALLLRTHWNGEKQWPKPVVELNNDLFEIDVSPHVDEAFAWTVRITPKEEALKERIFSLRVRATQRGPGQKIRSTSSSFWVRRASVFQAIIPQRINLPKNWMLRSWES